MTKPRFGSGLVGSSRHPQRYATQDPAPHLPFSNPVEPPLPSPRTVLISFLVVLLGFLLGLLWEVL